MYYVDGYKSRKVAEDDDDVIVRDQYKQIDQMILVVDGESRVDRFLIQ